MRALYPVFRRCELAASWRYRTFDLAEISITQAHSGGKDPLGKPPLLPVLTDSRPKTLQRGVLRA
jgi:hypothetical protein